MQILQSGRGDIYFQDPDAVRAQQAHKAPGLIDKLMTEKEAVSRFVADGNYLGCDLTYFIHGPNALLHEIILEQRHKLQSLIGLMASSPAPEEKGHRKIIFGLL
jgi:hypothetical protein